MKVKPRTKRVSVKYRRKLRSKLRLHPGDAMPDIGEERAHIKWLSKKQVAEALNIGELTAAAMLRSGQIPGMDIGIDGDLVCNAEEFSDWMVITQNKLGYKLPWTEPVVYFIQRADDPKAPIKIGTTGRDRLGERLSQLQVGSPYKLHYLAVMRGNDLDEARLHESFAHAHVSGEWFEPTEGLLSLIAGLTV